MSVCTCSYILWDGISLLLGVLVSDGKRNKKIYFSSRPIYPYITFDLMQAYASRKCGSISEASNETPCRALSKSSNMTLMIGHGIHTIYQSRLATHETKFDESERRVNKRSPAEPNVDSHLMNNRLESKTHDEVG